MPLGSSEEKQRMVCSAIVESFFPQPCARAMPAPRCENLRHLAKRGLPGKASESMSSNMTQLVVRCPVCGQQNRLPATRLGERARCGQCHEERLLSSPIPVDEETLGGLIRESRLPLLVDFWAPWCGPCRTVAPVLDEMARTRGGDVLFLKVNVDENQRTSAQHGISGIPALVLFHKGSERERLVGAHPKRNIEALLQRHAPAHPAS